ncbi:MAG: AtpZ/AtpI family protein [Elusimicrobia bacterium]|nr:AtpZ/AtpI family protein [Elusimicrobiota bacterium]
MIILPPGSGKYLSIGVDLAVAFLGGMLIGYQLDIWLLRFPLWTAIGASSGIALGFYNIYIRLKK